MSRNISAVSCLPNPYSEPFYGLIQSILRLPSQVPKSLPQGGSHGQPVRFRPLFLVAALATLSCSPPAEPPAEPEQPAPVASRPTAGLPASNLPDPMPAPAAQPALEPTATADAAKTRAEPQAGPTPRLDVPAPADEPTRAPPEPSPAAEPTAEPPPSPFPRSVPAFTIPAPSGPMGPLTAGSAPATTASCEARRALSYP